MANYLFLPILFFFLSNEIFAQDEAKFKPKPIKLDKLQIEIIQSDGYAFAEASCRYDLSRLKLAKDKEDKRLEIEVENNKSLLYEVMSRGDEKYSELSLNKIYTDAYNSGKIMLRSCIQFTKLRAQGELEKTIKK